VFDERGIPLWTRAFGPADAPFGLATAGDTLAILLYPDAGSESTRLWFFRVGNHAPVRQMALSVPRGSSAYLVPSLAGPFHVVRHTWGVPAGREIRPKQTQTYEYLRLGSGEPALVLSREEPRPPRATNGGWFGFPAGVAKPAFAAANGRLFISDAGSGIIRRVGASGFGPERIVIGDTSGLGGSDARRVVVSAIAIGDDGAAAVVRHDVMDQRQRFADSVYVQLVEPSGRLSGYAILPPGTRVHAYRAGKVYASRVDTSAVLHQAATYRVHPTHVLRYRLTPR
jgi:hypothetical protein